MNRTNNSSEKSYESLANGLALAFQWPFNDLVVELE